MTDPRGELDAPAGVSERSHLVALVLAGFGGMFGLHRFYAGKTQSGVLMCVTLGGLGLWYLYDLVLVLAGEFRDAEGLPVARWEVAGAGGYRAPSERRVEEFEDRLEELQREVGDLAERLDFAERLLAQKRERDALPPGKPR